MTKGIKIMLESEELKDAVRYANEQMRQRGLKRKKRRSIGEQMRSWGHAKPTRESIRNPGN